jgi:hypothetical protein
VKEGLRGSITAFSEEPTIVSPLALIAWAILEFEASGGSAPRLVTTVLRNSNAWKTKGRKPLSPPQKKQPPFIGVEVAESPTARPRLFRAGTELKVPLKKLAGPPNVPISMNL